MKPKDWLGRKYIIGKYKIVCNDGLNWEIYVWRANMGVGALADKVFERYHNQGRYYQTLDRALEYVLELMLREGGGDISTVEQFRELLNNSVEAIREAVRKP